MLGSNFNPMKGYNFMFSGLENLLIVVRFIAWQNDYHLLWSVLFGGYKGSFHVGKAAGALKYYISPFSIRG